MGVHHITWHSTASGLEDETIHAAALAWLVGDNDAIIIERMSSYHGSYVHMVTAELTRKGPATKSLARLGVNALDLLKEQLGQRMDEDNVIHIRLDLLDLIAGKITLTSPGDRPTVKGKTKLQVYPGDDVTDIAHQTLHEAIVVAKRLNLNSIPQ